MHSNENQLALDRVKKNYLKTLPKETPIDMENETIMQLQPNPST